ncbi:glycerophosphodiester phosphodiesterase family protein [Pelagibacterium sp. H642]|uniref:glycerophosphodiester phosphodiesterase family protein n=1 Tax=Pelagibacterium sp. H642 TaxID=1881069 RepID=UPI0028161B30|nr:glycerophosphodiester phosphodiesterase family protein [Pelagibacterium sp. H642]WMT90431.1 glycerophosphodiester phosphodiesterase family protein [Pelagibacterium sp. H642]
MSDYMDFISSPDRKCAIAAHRGAWHGAPENSIAAIEAAIAKGYEIVEIDVRRSADGELFVLHDDTLERMAGIARKPEEFDLADLQKTTLRTRNGGETVAMTEHTVPSLKQVFETIRGRIFVDLDLKDMSLFPQVADLAKEMGVAREVDLKASTDNEAGFSWLSRQAGNGGIPFMAMARFTRANLASLPERVGKSGAFICETKFENLDILSGAAPDLAEAGLSVWVNTLDPVNSSGFRDSLALDDPDTIWGTLIATGVSVIQTDEPEALQAYLGTRAS